MYYYVMYENEESDMSVARFDTANLACCFIEEKLESGTDYGLVDFEVIHGTPLSVWAETKQVIHLGV